MADDDGFEIIDEPEFEFIQVNDVVEKETVVSLPATPDTVLPLLIPQPLIVQSPEIVQEQQEPIAIVYSPKPEESPISRPSFVPIQKATSPPPPLPRIFAPVPLLPKAPAPKRYGDAALIPHNLDQTSDMDTIINKSRETQRIMLNISLNQPQKQDIQTVLEQHRQVFNRN